MSKTPSHELLKRKAVHNFPFIFDLNVVSLNCQKCRECNETLGLLFPIHEHMQTHFTIYQCKMVFLIVQRKQHYLNYPSYTDPIRV